MESEGTSFKSSLQVVINRATVQVESLGSQRIIERELAQLATIQVQSLGKPEEVIIYKSLNFTGARSGPCNRSYCEAGI